MANNCAQLTYHSMRGGGWTSFWRRKVDIERRKEWRSTGTVAYERVGSALNTPSPAS
jgi:hypothetical protein